MNLVFTWQLSELTVVLTAFPFPYHAPEGRTETLLVTYIPQMLATNIQYKYIYIKKITFPDPAPEGRTETLLVTYIPQMLAANIQYKKIY